MRRAPAPSLDDCDLEILALLQDDARMANAEIGRRLGLVTSAIFQRVRKLQEHGVIAAHETRVDARAIGLGLTAFISVRAEERVGSCETAQRIAALSEVQEVHHVAGEDCYLVKVRVPDAEALGRFLREQIGALESVRSTRTTIVLETLKETAKLPLAQARSDARSDG